MATYIKLASGLVQLDSPVTSSSISQALGYTPSNFSGSYNDLTDKPIDGDILTSNNNVFYIADNNENIIALIDEKGIHSIDFDINGKSVKDHIEDKDIHISAAEREKWNDPLSSNDSELYITDNNGNILALFNIDGLTISAIKTSVIKTNTFVITDDAENTVAQFDEAGLNVTQITTNKINDTDANDLATKTYITEQIKAINETLTNIDSILEPVEAEIDTLQQTVADIETKTDNIEASENDSTFIITDKDNNAIAQFDESGLTVFEVNATSIKENGIAIWNQENLQAMTDTEINSLVDEVFSEEE